MQILAKVETGSQSSKQISEGMTQNKSFTQGTRSVRRVIKDISSAYKATAQPPIHRRPHGSQGSCGGSIGAGARGSGTSTIEKTNAERLRQHLTHNFHQYYTIDPEKAALKRRSAKKAACQAQTTYKELERIYRANNGQTFVATAGATVEGDSKRDENSYSSIFSSKKASLMNQSRQRDLTPNPVGAAVGRTITTTSGGPNANTVMNMRHRSTSPKVAVARAALEERRSP